MIDDTDFQNIYDLESRRGVGSKKFLILFYPVFDFPYLRAKSDKNRKMNFLDLKPFS